MTQYAPTSTELLERHKAVMAPWVELFYEHPIEITSGKGCIVTDRDGKQYLDFYSGIATNLLGYGVPEIGEAVSGRLGSGVVHTSTFYLIREQVELAERIAKLSGIPDPVVFFGCSGTEAIETALLVTTEYRNSNQVIAARYSYHGRSFGALSVTGDRQWQGAGLTPLRVAYARSGERRYGGMAALGEHDYVRACAEDLEELIVTATPQRTAAMIVEPVQGIGGAIPLLPGQLTAYAEVLHRHGIPLIVDEVQTGWGRTGRYWGYQWDDVVPDMLTFAKGVGNGLTLGGVVGRRDIMSSLSGRSVSTFGGNPLSTAAATATLDYIDSHDLVDQADTTGRIILEGLRTALADHPWVYEVRGRGLLQAVEFVDPDTGGPSPQTALAVQESCRERNLLVGVGGVHGNCIRMNPPLTLSEEQAREGLGTLTSVIRDVQDSRAA